MISNYVAIATLITLVLIFFKVPVFASVFLVRSYISLSTPMLIS